MHWCDQRHKTILLNLQYKRLLTLHEDFTFILHDFTLFLIFIIVQSVESIVQYVETKDSPVNLTAFYY